MSLNFTVGPVQSWDSILEIGKEQVPYFRTNEFSQVVLESEELLLKYANFPCGSRAIFLTSSGTGAMEAIIMNMLSSSDKVLVINGGSFGQRFVDICTIHGVPYDEIILPMGKNIDESLLSKYSDKKYSALLVNADETSTGTLYDLNLLSRFCKENNMFFIVDAISSFLADTIDASVLGINALIVGSQKALACPPGISILMLDNRAIKIIKSHTVKSLYFNLNKALVDGERGQTPFTPAVGTILQIHKRLIQIKQNGGPIVEINRVSHIANDFRKKAEKLPISLLSESPSNAVSAYVTSCDANQLFLDMKSQYDIWICPNGGSLKHTVFRVGHIGNISEADNDYLIDSLSTLLN